MTEENKRPVDYNVYLNNSTGNAAKISGASWVIDDEGHLHVKDTDDKTCASLHRNYWLAIERP